MRRFCSLRSYSQFCIRIRNSQFRGLPAPTVLIFTVPVASSSAESLLCFITRPQIAQKCHKPANYPHKLTKTAEPWLGGGAALSGSELHAGVTSAALRSSRCALVAAAAAPPEGGRHGGRSLQLRVSALGAPRELREITSESAAILVSTTWVANFVYRKMHSTSRSAAG